MKTHFYLLLLSLLLMPLLLPLLRHPRLKLMKDTMEWVRLPLVPLVPLVPVLLRL